jgi:hypothetical protein
VSSIVAAAVGRGWAARLASVCGVEVVRRGLKVRKKLLL